MLLYLCVNVNRLLNTALQIYIQLFDVSVKLDIFITLLTALKF